MVQPEMQATRDRRGRYIISIASVHAGDPRAVAVHDSRNKTEQCNVDDIKPADRSYFDDLEWALGKGYHPCRHCMTTPGLITDDDTP